MADTTKIDSKFLYGIGSVAIDGYVVGYIEKDSFDWGGTEASSVDIEAEQVPGSPVLTLQQTNGTIKPTFNLIQLDYENLAKLCGGTLVKDASENVIGWQAPVDLTQVTGKVVITTVSGRVITIYKATVMTKFDGKLALSEVTKIAVTLNVILPDDGSAPYKISDTADDGDTSDGDSSENGN